MYGKLAWSRRPPSPKASEWNLSLGRSGLMPDIDRSLLLSCVDNTAPAIIIDGWSDANSSRDRVRSMMHIVANSISCREAAMPALQTGVRSWTDVTVSRSCPGNDWRHFLVSAISSRCRSALHLTVLMLRLSSSVITTCRATSANRVLHCGKNVTLASVRSPRRSPRLAKTAYRSPHGMVSSTTSIIFSDSAATCVLSASDPPTRKSRGTEPSDDLALPAFYRHL